MKRVPVDLQRPDLRLQSGSRHTSLDAAPIFTNVLILILSLVVSGRYEMVFRNAAFVLSIILLRFSLAEDRPHGAPLALFAIAFGILTLLMFNFHSRIRTDNSLAVFDFALAYSMAASGRDLPNMLTHSCRYADICEAAARSSGV